MFSPHHSAAARALIDMPELDAEDVAKKAMNIAANMCVYTNHEFVVECLVAKKKEEAAST
jgi:ATP-dependent HslUV protease, peptidase subunit HslV